jgi:hypothetical protein
MGDVMAERRSRRNRAGDKDMLHRVFGYDAYGRPVTEMVAVTKPSRWERLRHWLMGYWPERWWHVAYRLGLTRVRRIDRIDTRDG